MSDDRSFFNGRYFDGTKLHEGAFHFRDDRLIGIDPTGAGRGHAGAIDLGGDILSDGYTDLQVNGGGGLMFNDDPSVATLQNPGSSS